MRAIRNPNPTGPTAGPARETLAGPASSGGTPVRELPASVRYVKNGPAGAWWKDAKAASRLHAGWSQIPDALLQDRDSAAIAALIRSQYGTKAGATQDLKALLTLLEAPSQHLWITFEDGFLWWSTVKDDVTINDAGLPGCGHFWLTLDRPWQNRSLAGRYLAISELPGTVTSTAGFKGTVCEPKAWADILRLIRDDPDPDAAAARAARLAYEGAISALVKRLGPKDFEALVDLILSRSGWTRIAKLGGATEGIDVEVESPAIGEIAFVQVKSQATQGVLDDYVGRFRRRRDRYARMIFAVHSPNRDLHLPPAEPIQVWDRQRISELVVALGLGEWVSKRVA